MSLFEWLGEGFNPTDVGSVEVGRGDQPQRSPTVVRVRFIIAMAVLGGVYSFVFSRLATIDLRAIAIVVGVTLGYLLAGYFFRPQADTSNLGWLGGLIDHPFRYSDDINRFLLFFQILLWPGRFLADSLVDAVRLFWRGGKDEG